MSTSTGVNVLAVVVSAVVIFMLGGLWYSPVLFAKRWVALQGKSMDDMRAMGAKPVMYVEVFICGLVTAWVLAVVIAHYGATTLAGGALVGALCWVGFAGATSYG